MKVGIKILNGKWDEWWEKERNEKIEIKREDIKRLIPENIWEEKERDRKLPEIRVKVPQNSHHVLWE